MAVCPCTSSATMKGFNPIYVSSFSGGQICIDNPDARQRGSHSSMAGSQVIVPSASTNCTVRITRLIVSMDFGGYFNGGLPIFQVWRPSSPGSSVYNRVSRAQLLGQLLTVNNYYIGNFVLGSPVEFQPGDVIGYYQSSSPFFTIWNIETSGYTSYSNNANSPATTINISDVDNVENDRQPLIELFYGKKRNDSML